MAGLGLQLRIWLSRHFRRTFSGLYSTLDNPAEIPVQVAAYHLVTERYIRKSDSVLDVGFGIGCGLRIMVEKAEKLSGIEVDRKTVRLARNAIFDSRISGFEHYDGYSIPFKERSFDVVTCIDVIEHVPDYLRLLNELCRITKRIVFLSTPNRRIEHTGVDGKPKNPWHIREWSYEEFDRVLMQLGKNYEWNFLNGPWEGPFSVSQRITNATIALTPAIIIC